MYISLYIKEGMVKNALDDMILHRQAFKFDFISPPTIDTYNSTKFPKSLNAPGSIFLIWLFPIFLKQISTHFNGQYRI